MARFTHETTCNDRTTELKGSCIYKCLSSGLTLLEGAYVGVVAMDLDRERENEVGDGPFRVSGTKLP